MFYGIKTVLRTKVKTTLFVVLIGLITALLATGIGIWSSAERMMDELDDTFLTVGELIYVGGNYPDNTLMLDHSLMEAKAEVDFEALTQLPGVIHSEPSVLMRAGVVGFEPFARPFEDQAVFVMEVQSFDADKNAHRSAVKKVIYSAKNDEERRGLYVMPPEYMPDMVYQNGHEYIMYGSLVQDYYVTYFLPEAVPEMALNSGAQISADAMTIADVTGFTDADWEAFWQSDQGRMLKNIGEMYHTVNRTVTLTGTGKIEAIEAFHRNEYELISGSFFTPQDYIDGGAVVVSSYLANKMELTIGDTLHLNIHYPSEKGSIYHTYWPESGFAVQEEPFRIAGIYQGEGRAMDVYVAAAGQPWLNGNENDFTIGRFVINNRYAASFMENLPQLPGDVVLNIYDQGYETAALPILGMRQTAQLITIASGGSCFVLLVFFAFLFVLRNGFTASVLLTLGSGRRRIINYFLSGCGVISLVATALGGLAGYGISLYSVQKIYDAALNNAAFDRRYSRYGYGILRDMFVGTPTLDAKSFVLASLLVFVLAMVLCSLFTWGVVQRQYSQSRNMGFGRKEKRAKRQKDKPRRLSEARFYDVLPFASLRYTAKSLLRNGRKNAVVPLVMAVMLIFLSLFSGVKADYVEQKATVYDRIPVTMRITDFQGKRIDRILIPGEWIDELNQSDFVAQASPGVSMSYHINGIVQRVSGLPGDAEMHHIPVPEILPVPGGEKEYSDFVGRLRLDFETLTQLPYFELAPELLYATTPELTFAPGYGPEHISNAALTLDEPIIILPAQLMAERGIELGDTVQVTIYQTLTFQRRDRLFNEIWHLPVAAAFTSPNTRETAYMPAYNMEMRGMIPDAVQTYELDRDTYEIIGEMKNPPEWAKIEPYMNSVLLYGIVSEAEGSGDGTRHIEVERRLTGYNKYTTASFLLENTENLGEFKDWLSTRYSQVNMQNSERRWAVIDDVALYSTVENLDRHIMYMDLAYPVILLVSAVIGFLLSHLLLRGRGREIAVMRGIGSRKMGIFNTLFWEQLLLCVPGIIVALGGSYLIHGNVNGPWLMDAAIFVVCYLLGTAFSVIQILRKNVLKQFGDKEA